MATGVDRPHRLACGLLVAALLAIYLPDVGRGFLRDDFSWIHQHRVSGLSDLGRLFRQDNGFYRPLVGVTFAIDYAIFGLRPYPFALTNVLLLLLAAVALARVARRLGLTPGAALLACALWAFNPHGVPMALLWISGRTSILLCLFALAAAEAVLRGRRLAAGAFCLAALLSKEEAVLLPVLLAGWSGFAEGEPRWRLRRAMEGAWPCFAALVPYFLLRSITRAYLPHTAPDFYRPTLDLAALARNVIEYADRSCTLAAAVLLVLWLFVRRRARMEAGERTIVWRGLMWLVLGFGLTVFVPVRSSLYALFPSIGAALAAAAMAQALWREAAPWPRRWLPLAALALPFLAIPVFRARAVRWVRPASVSAQVLADLSAEPADADTITILHDTERTERGLAGAFGTLLPEALDLVGHRGRVFITPPPPGSVDAGSVTLAPGQQARHLYLRDGRLIAMPAAATTPPARSPVRDSRR